MNANAEHILGATDGEVARCSCGNWHEAPKKNEIVTVDLSKTIGQESAIEANGSSIFEIKVTVPAVDYNGNAIAGFGRVVSSGPVNGYEVLFTAEAVVR